MAARLCSVYRARLRPCQTGLGPVGRDGRRKRAAAPPDIDKAPETGAVWSPDGTPPGFRHSAAKGTTPRRSMSCLDGGEAQRVTPASGGRREPSMAARRQRDPVRERLRSDRGGTQDTQIHRADLRRHAGPVLECLARRKEAAPLFRNCGKARHPVDILKGSKLAESRGLWRNLQCDRRPDSTGRMDSGRRSRSFLRPY